MRKENVLILSDLLAWIDARGETLQSVPTTVQSLLRFNKTWQSLILDEPPDMNQVEESIFRGIAHVFRSVSIKEELEVIEIKKWLEVLVTSAMPKLESIAFSGSDVTVTESKAIFVLLGTISSLQALGISFGRSDDNLARSFADHVRNTSSLKAMVLSLQRREDDGTISSISETALESIGTALGESTSLKELYINQPPNEVALVLRSAEIIAQGASKSTSLMQIRIQQGNLSSVLVDYLCRALLQTEAVKSMELGFVTTEKGNAIVSFHRQLPFRRFLSQRVPAGLWPRILAKADMWNEQTSHSSLDALFFLVKEQHVELLRNARHVRKQRKRKLDTISD